MVLQISREQARRFLARYHFLATDLPGVFDRLGTVQYDPLNPVGRNPDRNDQCGRWRTAARHPCTRGAAPVQARSVLRARGPRRLRALRRARLLRPAGSASRHRRHRHDAVVASGRNPLQLEDLRGRGMAEALTNASRDRSSSGPERRGEAAVVTVWPPGAAATRDLTAFPGRTCMDSPTRDSRRPSAASAASSFPASHPLTLCFPTGDCSVMHVTLDLATDNGGAA